MASNGKENLPGDQEKIASLRKQVEDLEQRYAEAEEALDALRHGTVDALVISTDEEDKIYTLQGAETTYRLMVESLNEGAASLVEDGTILYCNQRFSEMLGIPLEAIIGSTIQQYLPSNSKSAFNSLLELGLMGKSRGEVELLRKDGNLIPAMVSINSFSAASSPGVCLVVTDLTDRKLAAEMKALAELKSIAEEKLRQAHNKLQLVNQELIAEIAEHEKTEEALDESRKRYQDLIETTSEFIWETDRFGNYTYCSPQMEKLWGLKPHEMIGKTPFEIMPSEERDGTLEYFRELTSSATPFRGLTSSAYNTQGDLIYIETSGVPFFDRNGGLLGYRGITRDITERKLAEEMLQRAYEELEQRVRERTSELTILNEELKAEVIERKVAEETARRNALLAEGLAQSIMVLNSSLDLEHVLDAILEQLRNSVPYTIAAITQFEKGAVRLTRATDLGNNINKARATELADLILSVPIQNEISETKQPFYIEDLSKLQDWIKVPGIEWVRSYLAVPLVAGGKFNGTIHLTSDQVNAFNPEMISHVLTFAAAASLALQNALLYKDLENALQKEQTMRLQLIQAEKLSALSRMLATVVHEINNPVQTIKNCIYLARMDTPVNTSAGESLIMAASEADRIGKLVAGLREIYRQPKNIQVEHMSILDLLDEVHTMLDPHLLHNNVIWSQDLSEDHLWIYGIEDHLKQVFLNIAMNAIEAMQPAGGVMTVRATCYKETNEISVTVSDTGPGIDPQDVEKLFEPFYTTKEGGSGLGLPICYEIVQQHSGRITVDSAPGKGSSFTVWLPINSPKTK